MNKLSKRADLILIIGLLVIGAIIAVFYFAGNKKGSMVVVAVDGVVVERHSLDVDGEYEIANGEGGHNTLKIENGYASVTDATCPDHICMNMGKINSGSQSIVCLPNKLVVTIETGSISDVDVIAK